MSNLTFNEVLIRLEDLEDIRSVINAAGVLMNCEDMKRAQINYSDINMSPLTQELIRVKERIDGYIAEFLLHRYENEDEPEVEEIDELEDVTTDLDSDITMQQEASESLTEASEDDEPLADNPLGSVKPKRQVGVRVSS